MEHVLRSSLLAAMLADELDLDDEQRATVYYTNLVLWIGCHADSHEFSRWFGDDLAMRRDSYQLDWSGLPYLAYLVRRTGSARPLPDAHPAAAHAAADAAHPDGGADPLALPVGGPDGRAHRARPERGRGGGLRLRALGRERPAGGTQRRRAAARDARGPARRGVRGAPADARDERRAGDGAGPQRSAVRPGAGRGAAALPQPDQRAARPGRLVAGAGARPRPGRDAARRRPRRAAARARRLRGPEVPVHGRPLARGRGAGGCSGEPAGAAAGRRRASTTGGVRARPRPDGRAELGLGEAGHPDGVGPGAHPAVPLPDRPHPQPRAGAAGRGLDRRGTPRAPRRLRLPAWAERVRAADDPADPGRGRQLPRVRRGATAPPGARSRGGGGPAPRGGAGGSSGQGPPSTPCSPRQGTVVRDAPRDRRG